MTCYLGNITVERRYKQNCHTLQGNRLHILVIMLNLYCLFCTLLHHYIICMNFIVHCVISNL